MRVRLLALLNAKLAHARQHQSTELLDDDTTLTELVDLLHDRRPATEHGPDLAVLSIAGWVFYLRHLNAPEQTRLPTFVAACQLLGPVHLADPGSLPPMVAAFYATGADPREFFSWQTGMNTDPEVWVALVREPMTRFLADHTDLATARLVTGLLRLACVAAGDRHPDRTRYLGGLASHLAVLRPLVDDLETARASAEANQAMLDAMPASDPARGLFLQNLGVARFTVGRDTDRLDLVEQAVDLFREALPLARSADERNHLRLNLGGALGHLGAFGTRHALLHEAAVLLRETAAGTGPVADAAVKNLRAMLGQAMAGLQTTPDDDALLALCTGAVRPEPPDAPLDALFLIALMYLLMRRYQLPGGTLQDATRAIAYGRRAHAVTRTGRIIDHAERASLLHNLGSCMRTVAQISGDVALVDEAIDLGRQACAAPASPGLDQATLLASLASSLACRFDLAGDRAAQREALAVSRQAVAYIEAGGTPGDSLTLFDVHTVQTDDPDAGQHTVAAWRAAVLHAHTAVLRNSAHILDDLSLLREAVDIRRELAAEPGITERTHGRRLHAYSDVLRDLAASVRGADRATFAREAVDLARRGMALTPDDDVDRYAYQGNLGRALRLLGQIEGETTGPEAVLAARRARDTTDPKSPWWAFHSLHLGLALYHESDSTDAIEQALAAFEAAAHAPAARPDVRVNSGRMYAEAALRLDRPAAAVDALAEAVAHLPFVASPDQSRLDRERILRDQQGLTAQIVRACVAAGDPARAVELLEQARGLLYAEALGARGDLSELQRLDSDLYAQFNDVLRRIRGLDSAEPAPGTDRQAADLRGTTIAERNALIARIRTSTPLTDFLKPPGLSQLRAQACDGPIIIVASTGESGHALIITADADRPVRHVPLPGLAYEQASDRVLTFLAARTVATDPGYSIRARIRGQREVASTLSWLWTVAAEPIMEALGAAAVPDADDAELPRVWWCPVGFLANLPWHAAGPHDRGTAAAVLDRVVSSYTVSIRALQYARARPVPPPGGSMLIVAQPTLPGAGTLGGVAAEVDRITRHVPETEQLSESRARKAEVLAGLARHPYAHFACHALSDLREPGRSRLILADHETDPLTVRDLSALHLEAKELAVLSACSTYETNPSTADDAVHLTAAFQLLGFRHVVGSLWPVSDGTAVDLADTLYHHLTGGGRQPLDATATATALHRAVRALRTRFPAAPTVWAAYLHTGA
ncbi:CHAT domain-containing protein [Catellatospora methionotrophica]|uniref:CHAT domain-containing protein n=1 Tax=Catellatospora methionotrophica TaxID=121620 RepID=UPI0033CD7159